MESHSTKEPAFEILQLKGDIGKVYEGILESVKDIADHLRYSTSNKI